MAASRGEFAAFPTNHVTTVGVAHPAGQHDYKLPHHPCVSPITTTWGGELQHTTG